MSAILVRNLLVLGTLGVGMTACAQDGPPNLPPVPGGSRSALGISATTTTLATTTTTLPTTTTTADPCQPLSNDWAQYLGHLVEQGPFSNGFQVVGPTFILNGAQMTSLYMAGWPNAANAASAAPTSTPYLFVVLTGPGPLSGQPMAITVATVQAVGQYNDQYVNYAGPVPGFVWAAENIDPQIAESPFGTVASHCAEAAVGE